MDQYKYQYWKYWHVGIFLVYILIRECPILNVQWSVVSLVLASETDSPGILCNWPGLIYIRVLSQICWGDIILDHSQVFKFQGMFPIDFLSTPVHMHNGLICIVFCLSVTGPKFTRQKVTRQKFISQEPFDLVTILRVTASLWSSLG